jgi:hypothetical protein
MKIHVAQPFRVVHDGKAYGPGDTADVPERVGRDWIRQGWAVEVKAAPPRKRSG